MWLFPLIFQALVADAHPICRLGLKTLIANAPDMVLCGETDSVDEAQQLIQQHHPHCLVAGLNLARGNGLQLIHSVRALHPNLPILILSVHDEDLYAERALRAGATGFIHKSEPLNLVLHAIRHTIKGRIYLSETFAERLLRTHLHGQKITQEPHESRLSDREMAVYMLLGLGYSTKRIADELHVSPKTVDSHKEHIKEKLGLANNRSLLRRALAWSIEKNN